MATQSDDFNRASLGTTDPAGGSTYTGRGTWTISGSTVLAAPATGSAPATNPILVYDTGFASADLSVDVVSIGSGAGGVACGICSRWSDTSNHFQTVVFEDTDSELQIIQIVKIEAGSSSVLAEWDVDAAGYAAPFNFRLIIDGNNFYPLIDDVYIGAPDSGTASSSFNNTATYHGTLAIRNGSAVPTYDNWFLDSSVTAPSFDVSDSETFTMSDASTGLEIVQADTFTLADNQGLALDQSDQSSGDGFRLTESASLSKNGALLLERPLYALIESNVRTAQILDYWEAHPDDETRETGIDVDL